MNHNLTQINLAHNAMIFCSASNKKAKEEASIIEAERYIAEYIYKLLQDHALSGILKDTNADIRYDIQCNIKNIACDISVFFAQLKIKKYSQHLPLIKKMLAKISLFAHKYKLSTLLKRGCNLFVSRTA